MNIQIPQKAKGGLKQAEIDLLPQFKHVIKDEAAS